MIKYSSVAVFIGEHVLILLIIILIAALSLPAGAHEWEPESSPWRGHDFVFCFVTDDGTACNLAWADTARTMGFRFTIAINALSHRNGSTTFLTAQQIHELADDGFEIANHGYSHGFLGLAETCPKPPRGSLMGYFLCEDVNPIEAMEALHVEIERDSVAVLCDIPVASVRTLAYPRHCHGKALIDSLISEGYIGARTGGLEETELYSYGDFPLYAHNGWDEGISLFRVPTQISDSYLFGDHSADPPIHFTYEEFLAKVLSRIQNVRQKGGIFVIYTHHLGNDDDSYGDITYPSGGVTKQDLAWLVDLVRANNGIVLPFGEAVAYYRSHTTMVDLDGDYVWMPGVSSVENMPRADVVTLTASPNPFNPRTVFVAALPVAGDVRLDVYDAQGGHVRLLASESQIVGLHEWIWDGRNDAGLSLAAGVYLAKLETGLGSVSSKVLLLK